MPYWVNLIVENALIFVESMKKIDALRKKYPEFVYQEFEWKYLKPNLEIWFDFLIRSTSSPNKDLKFKTQITVKKVSNKHLNNINKRDLDNLIFHLGLIEMLNYWKLTCSPNILINARNLYREEKMFLRKTILNGMGEYFYKNQIDFTKSGFLNIKVNQSQPLYKASTKKLSQNKILVPIGGGKDSPVTIELLKKKGNILGGFILNAKSSQLKIAKIANLREVVLIERKLDPLLLKLNKSGKFLNGHVPFSAFLAYLSLIVALIFNYGRIVFSWEKSANEPNLKYKGRWINHQWSKTSKFEKEFNRLAKKYLLKNVNVFSALRKFSELEIAQIFARLKKYHSVFLSCNNAYKISAKKLKWCGECPKCLFVFAILYPFLEERELVKIFGRNLFEDKSLLPLMLKLVGKKETKPFECVGTKKETFLAFSLALKRAKKRKKVPFLLKKFEELHIKK